MENDVEKLQEKLGKLENEVTYLQRKLFRLKNQQSRQESIDEINRNLLKRANKKLEDARHSSELANKAKTEFLANMSHEIRTPLNIVLGMGELLDGTRLDPSQKQYLKSLRSSGRHLLELINNILEFSRIESGIIEVEPEPFNLYQLIKSVEGMVSHLAQEKGIGFVLEVDRHITCGRYGDAGKIKQVLINLLGNAIKFTAKGKVSLRVKEADDGEGNAGIQFIVTDTGIGIPHNKQDKVFERFTQAEEISSRYKSGVGLGLAICRRLVIAMGGFIGFDSHVGQGTTFNLFLPLSQVKTSPVIKQNQLSAISDLERFPSLRLLVVDDVSANIDVIVNYLHEYPVVIQRADDGQMALDYFANNQYDIVLMDIRMPLMDGLTAMQIIREIEQSISGPVVHIIAMTAHAFKEQRKSFIEAGFDDVLIKPFSKKDLTNSLIIDKKTKHALLGQSSGSVLTGAALPGIDVFSQLPEPLIQMIPGVLRNISDAFQDISKALAMNDLGTLNEICHSAKGVAAMYGLQKLTGLIEDLEKCAESNDSLAARELSDTVELYVEELIQKIEYQD